MTTPDTTPTQTPTEPVPIVVEEVRALPWFDPAHMSLIESTDETAPDDVEDFSGPSAILRAAIFVDGDITDPKIARLVISAILAHFPSVAQSPRVKGLYEARMSNNVKNWMADPVLKFLDATMTLDEGITYSSLEMFAFLVALHGPRRVCLEQSLRLNSDEPMITRTLISIIKQSRYLFQRVSKAIVEEATEIPLFLKRSIIERVSEQYYVHRAYAVGGDRLALHKYKSEKYRLFHLIGQ